MVFFSLRGGREKVDDGGLVVVPRLTVTQLAQRGDGGSRELSMGDLGVERLSRSDRAEARDGNVGTHRDVLNRRVEGSSERVVMEDVDEMREIDDTGHALGRSTVATQARP